MILLLVAAMLGALGYSLYALVRYRGRGGSQVFRGLAARVGLAGLLLLVLLIGLSTGALRPSAPWDRAPLAPAQGEAAP